MESTISIHAEGGDHLQSYVETISELQPELEADGILIEEIWIKSLVDVSTVLISIGGSVAGHYIVKCVDALLRKHRDAERDLSVKLVVEYHADRFEVPVQRDGLIEAIKAQTDEN
jgi:hypothetical protein